jgi:hypothetical protein
MSTRSEALSAALDKMGLGSDAALVLHFPLRYEDETRIVTPARRARRPAGADRGHGDAARSVSGRAASCW